MYSRTFVRTLLFVVNIIATCFVLAPLSSSQTCGIPSHVCPTDNLQNLVNQYGPNTTFVLQPGVHHDSVTTIKQGDTFTSPNGSITDGVIEDGAKTLPLSGMKWTQVTISGIQYWTTAGGTPLPPDQSLSTKCETDYPACYYPQDLYFTTSGTVVEYTHVITLAQVTHGTWFYDFTGQNGPINNIYVTDNPTAANTTVELGAHSYAFQSGTATSVTIKGLIIEKYAPGIAAEAVQAQAADWVIEDNEAEFNSGAGIGGKPGSQGIQILNNSSHDNGQFGIAGGTLVNATISNNTLFNNNTDHVSAGFGAGGLKLGTALSVLVSYNTVHDNQGNGLHADVMSDSVQFDHNTVYNHFGQGIRCEISDHCSITNNTIYNNGYGSTEEPGKSSQVGYASSSHGNIQGNVISYPQNSGGGISIGYDSGRGGCGSGCTIPVQTTATNNTIYVGGPNWTNWASELLDTSGTASQWIIADMYDKNTYCVPSTPWTTKNWLLSMNTVPYNSITFSSWQTGQPAQDTNGSLVLDSSCPTPPSK